MREEEVGSSRLEYPGPYLTASMRVETQIGNNNFIFNRLPFFFRSSPRLSPAFSVWLSTITFFCLVLFFFYSRFQLFPLKLSVSWCIGFDLGANRTGGGIFSLFFFFFSLFHSSGSPVENADALITFKRFSIRLCQNSFEWKSIR